MPALPKKKLTKHRIGNRRASQRLAVPTLVSCPRCHAAKVAHRACPSCGTYRGRFVLTKEGEGGETA